MKNFIQLILQSFEFVNNDRIERSCQHKYVPVNMLIISHGQ